jgi:hypothetical protein
MPRRNLQERLERMRRKLDDAPMQKPVTIDAEAFKALEETEPADSNIVRVAIHTGHCCGLKAEDDYLCPCLETNSPQFGNAFCSKEHQVEFESQLTSSALDTFYQIFATVNLHRPELVIRFYREFLPALYINVAGVLNKRLVIVAKTEEQHKALRDAFEDPFETANRFRGDLHQDIKKHLAYMAIAKRCVLAVAEASCREDLNLEGLVSTTVCLVSPSPSTSNTPRSAQQSPRTPQKSPKKSPRPATPLPATEP